MSSAVAVTKSLYHTLARGITERIEGVEDFRFVEDGLWLECLTLRREWEIQPGGVLVPLKGVNISRTLEHVILYAFFFGRGGTNARNDEYIYTSIYPTWAFSLRFG
jgi:hypothetical protein